MGDHYPLLVETPDANLVKGMRQLNGPYTQWPNRIHHRVGHVLQGRYAAILKAHDTGHYRYSEVAEHFKVRFTTVGRTVRAGRQARGQKGSA